MSAEKRARELIADWRKRHEQYDDQQSAESKKGYEVDWTYDARARSFEQAADELEALLDSAALTPQWEEISTAPRDGTFILAVCKGFTPAVAQWTTDFRPEGEFTFLEPGMFAAEDHWEEMLAQTDPWQPTHWLPLPAPPEGE